MMWTCYDMIVDDADDDSLPTRLTYGVKGPHTISREVEGEGWTTSLPQPTSTLVVARTVG
jgi:hypothetical protein